MVSFADSIPLHFRYYLFSRSSRTPLDVRDYRVPSPTLIAGNPKRGSGDLRLSRRIRHVAIRPMACLRSAIGESANNGAVPAAMRT